MFQVVAGASVFFICVSVLSFCLKTHPALRSNCDEDETPLGVNLTVYSNQTETVCIEEPLPIFSTVEHICNAWFTFELAVRLIVSSDIRCSIPLGFSVSFHVKTLRFMWVLEMKEARKKRSTFLVTVTQWLQFFRRALSFN